MLQSALFLLLVTATASAQAAGADGMTPANLLTGAAFALLATLLFAALLYGLERVWRRVSERLGHDTTAEDDVHSLGSFALRFAGHLAGLVRWGLWLALIYAWVVFVLECFPFSRPLGEQLGGLVLSTLTRIAQGAVNALPDIITLVVILFLTRAVVDVLGQVFDSVQSGKLQLPFLHRETTGATRRIITILIWGLGIAFAYPYIPGSNSEAFKGLSVLFGIVISLGSTGVMTQMMSGLVVVYSRALRKGDFVAVNDVEGMVVEVGTLATKLINMRNEEITIPNGVLISSPIHNYSKLSSSQGSLLSTKVTIGYDTPWRQVHAMLIAAARSTEGLRQEPAPVVYQRALSDFYVEYEVFAHINEPLHRIRILSLLHANIQDQFNEHGVQIMSPHFFDQPAEAVVVPKAKWFAAPADKPDQA
ncbi:mechanosensitive ion channel family protein [Viridibacterium curvum]|uniref:Small-conductance mechanosensitive channel n=1 Tax=Viridibacterium curvum TaxID=1101404 RepID=A0ABP9QQ47_9RHOO